MALCPRCQTELPQDSGFVLCPNCGHPSVLDINGNLVQKSEAPDPVRASVPQTHEMPPTSNDDQSEPAIASLDFHHRLGQNLGEHLEQSSEEEAQQPSSSPPSDFSFFNDKSSPDLPDSSEEPSQNDPFKDMPQSQDGLGISESLTQYANSELSQGKDGAFVYNVSISDIDSKEIREFLREAIIDTRFNWDAQAIISQIKKGELLLKNLSPVKASILINRIKRLPVKIRWEQYAITQAEQDIPSF